jgi:hypothetical protein
MMMNLEWPLPQDRTRQPSETSGLPAPFFAQGIRDALRNAYADHGEVMPDQLASLLDRLD